jgi:hypothetical protein
MVLFIGSEVMAQLPVMHPIYFQYKKPATAPAAAPMPYNLFLLIQFFIVAFFVFTTDYHGAFFIIPGIPVLFAKTVYKFNQCS